MATIKEKIEKIMEYTDATVEQLLNMCENELHYCYCSVNVIEEKAKSLAKKGIHLQIGEDCGCGGCEIAIAECVAEGTPNDELVELEEFIGAVYRLIEEYRRAEDEVQ